MEVLFLLALGLILGALLGRLGGARRVNAAAELTVYVLLFLLGIETSSRINWTTLKAIAIQVGVLTLGSIGGSILALQLADKIIIKADKLMEKGK